MKKSEMNCLAHNTKKKSHVESDQVGVESLDFQVEVQVT